MGKFTEYVGAQFGNPRGLIGAFCCRIMNRMNRAMYKRVVALLRVSQGAPVLEIGYGNGHLLRLIDKAYRAKLFGIDISADMQRLAQKKNASALREGRLFLCVGDCCSLPYEEESFAAVISVNTVYFWQDTGRGLREILRCLRPGGCFYNVVYTKEWLDALSYTKKGFQKFAPEQLAQLGREAGFSQVEIQEIVKGTSFAVIYKKQERLGT